MHKKKYLNTEKKSYHRWIDISMDRYIDRQIYRQNDRQIDRQIDVCPCWVGIVGSALFSDNNRQIERYIDRQND